WSAYSQKLLQSRTLLFHFCNRRHAPSPRTHILHIILVSVISSPNMDLHQYFGAMRLGYSDINMSTGPGIFIKNLKVNGELINIGSCCGPPAMPSRTTRGPRTPG